MKKDVEKSIGRREHMYAGGLVTFYGLWADFSLEICSRYQSLGVFFGTAQSVSEKKSPETPNLWCAWSYTGYQGLGNLIGRGMEGSNLLAVE
jgi:hypothetical protein